MPVVVAGFSFQHIATAIFDFKKITVLSIRGINKAKVFSGSD
jgi:hypothetical protein